MESHPIPQQISSYQFRLVGDMTLKQFFQLAGGALVSVIIYSTHMLAIFKWPLMIFSFALGAALAFLPFEERPLGKWLFAFFGSVYSPTIFNWKAAAAAPKFFQDEEVAAAPVVATTPTPINELDKKEQSFMSKLSMLFGQMAPKSIPATPVINITPTVTAPVIRPQPEQVITPVNTPTNINRATRVVVEENPTSAVTPMASNENKSVAHQAQFTPEAVPSAPNIPNTISGQVLDDQGKIVEGAILEIKDFGGRPVRALRSNKVGHFLVVTALQNGQYEIITDKEGLEFIPVSFEAKGEIIPPILIKATKSYEIPGQPYKGEPLVIN
jgi:hypothetical protein